MKIESLLLRAVVRMEVKSSLGNERGRKRITVETEGGEGRVSSLTVSLRLALDLRNEEFSQQAPGSRCVGCALLTAAVPRITN